jgi:hypothetical protein
VATPSVNVKTILIHGYPTKLYSIDGKMWASRPSDIEEFQRRLRREKITCQKWLRDYGRSGAIATVDMDFWP